MSARTILVVDDEPLIGELVAEILELHGYEARRVETGSDALRMAGSWHPQAIILDLMLPDIDGFEVCRRIRASESSEGPGILMLTGMPLPADRQRGFRAGADRYLTKPFTAPDLVSEIESLIREYDSPMECRCRRTSVMSLSGLRDDPQPLADMLCDLVRVTPLTTTEIEEFGHAVIELASACSSPTEPTGDMASWRMICRVFRDRLESSFEAAQVPIARSGHLLVDLLHRATDTLPPNLAALGDSLVRGEFPSLSIHRRF